ncbi:MAG: ribonuclease Z [Candidatus Undinarchaeales archaeon]
MIEITFLGTTAGLPTKERAHTAIALKLNGELLLFDCGENAQRQMMEAGLSPMKISSVFISHWHADHSAGLSSLIQTLSLMDRKKELKVFGPKGTKKAIKQLLKLHHWEGEMRYPLTIKEVKKGTILETDDYKVDTMPAVHQTPALSFKFKQSDKPGKFNVKKAEKLGLKKEQYGKLQKGKSVKVKGKRVKPEQVLGPKKKGKKIVFSGDTSYNKEFVKFAENADLLINEATFGGDMGKKAEEYCHCSAKEAGKIAKEADVEKLIITHFSPRYRDVKPLLKEAKEVFKKSKAAEDFMKIKLKR